MRFLLLIYTFICWAYPLLLVFGVGASGHGYGVIDKTLFAMLLASIFIVPLNYYFLYRVFITSTYTSGLQRISLILLFLTLALMAYLSYITLTHEDVMWIIFLPPVGFLLSIFFIGKLLVKRPDVIE